MSDQSKFSSGASDASALVTEDQAIDAFLAGTPFGVAGASHSRAKYGNKVLRCYWDAGRRAYPLNPNRNEVEGRRCYPDLAALPEPIHGLSLITQPNVSERVVDDALARGVRFFWFQPGAEHDAAIAQAKSADATVIAHGPCLLVVLGTRARTARP